MTLNSGGNSFTRTSSSAVNGLGSSVRGLAADAVGLGFGGAAVYGLTTGRMGSAALTTAIALAALYLGLKVPTGPSTTTPASIG